MAALHLYTIGLNVQHLSPTACGAMLRVSIYLRLAIPSTAASMVAGRAPIVATAPTRVIAGDRLVGEWPERKGLSGLGGLADPQVQLRVVELAAAGQRGVLAGDQ